MSVEFTEMVARKRSSCLKCDVWIEPGDVIVWETPACLASHKVCPVDAVGARGDGDMEDML